jgi:hypothetical protein
MSRELTYVGIFCSDARKLGFERTELAYPERALSAEIIKKLGSLCCVKSADVRVVGASVRPS